MKISKVNHIRMCVGKNNEEVKGKLYYNPSHKKEIDIKEHIDRQLKIAKILEKTHCDGQYKSEKINSAVLADSIEKQDVNVQVFNNGDKPILKLANSKNKNKEFEFEFLTEYASSTKEKQNEMLLHIQNIIIYYVYGTDNKKDRTEIWEIYSLANDKTNIFDENAENLIKELRNLNGSDNKDARKALKEKIKIRLHEVISIEKFNETKKFFKATPNSSDFGWIRFVENSLENILINKRMATEYKLNCGYLVTKVWKKFMSFIAIKYMALGKAVYHFAMPKDLNNLPKDVVIGEIRKPLLNGITSFDYERISAREQFERAISTYMTFAINTFANSIVSKEERTGKKNEDVLLYKNKKIKNKLLISSRRNILRYFGGISNWENTEFIKKYSDIEIAIALNEALYSLRNQYFHYTDSNIFISKETLNLVNNMYNKEMTEVNYKIRKKYYANNIPMFYTQNDINNVISSLYNKRKERPAQIPSFNKIMPRANFGTTINLFVKGKKMSSISREMTNFKSALYFICKEIYYYEFIQQDNLMDLFIENINKRIKKEEQNFKGKSNANCNNKGSNSNQLKAMENLIKRINEGKPSNFGELCQLLMTDYEQQNKDKNKHATKCNLNKRTGKNEKNNFILSKEKYTHFKMLLYVCLKDIFIEYLKKNYGFLREPAIIHENMSFSSENDYCSQGQISMFNESKSIIEQDMELSPWYVFAHFISPKQLNHLKGTIKNNIQYEISIEKRAEQTGNLSRLEEVKIKNNKYNKILEILDFVTMFNGEVSNNIEDYFEDKEEYAKFLSNFVDFKIDAADYFTSLQAFCNEKVRLSNKNQVQIGLYMDEKNPIVNRNIVMASMYCDIEFIGTCVKKINKDDFQKYYKDMEKLSKVFENGVCANFDEQKLLKEFQEEKNRLEFIDIFNYSEIISDLYGQLISWMYMRERDLMYLQLGYNYIRLFITNVIPSDSEYRKIEFKDIRIKDGTLLYQLVAINTYSLPVFNRNENGDLDILKEGMAGDSIKSFLTYCKDKGDIYRGGLIFFEETQREDNDNSDQHAQREDKSNKDPHDLYILLRDEIDHFKYFVYHDKSILELYSIAYDKLLAYDIKLKQSVTYVLQNILLNYFVDSKIEFFNDGYSLLQKKLFASNIKIKELKSDMFTYKITNITEQGIDREDKIKQIDELYLEAKNEMFRNQLKNILEYKRT